VINFAICGFGFMGSTHARCLSGRSDARLCAIADNNLSNLESAEREGNLSMKGPKVRLDGVSLHAELEAILRMPEIDVVDICLPLRLHYDWARRALDAGKHVLLEKPMVLDPAQGKELIDLARTNGRLLMVAHVVRFMPAYRALRGILKDGHRGSLEFLMMQRWAGVPAWGMWKDVEVRQSSGGGLFDLLIHDIDIVHWLLGKPSRIQSSVFAGPVSDHDFVNAVWHYDRGCAAILDGGFAFHSQLPFEARFLARFEKATVAFDSARPGVLNIADGQIVESMALEEDPLDGYRREIEYFIECVHEQRWPDECSPESSLQAVELALSHLPEKRISYR